ncbi:XRE family transcriptional regulator [Listeria monocytogenes]|uniref:helix-turn-helix domain-containing protein n=1 Tax=Listeria monocytogenes TaxID=1639 RepID=UPI0011EAF230|nr:helix-turn-helix transcriptional regulator [Listeria monocytogenes]EAG1758587.1 XRE family transcriptional regulator [Listeria monocytogenes]TYU88958.1 helix-turn-helix transcriptional regulator [Listeria monocytogenes]
MTSEEYTQPYFPLKSILDRKGLSQIELAQSIEMDRSTLNLKINRTEGRDFKLSEAILIAKKLNIRVDDFF